MADDAIPEYWRNTTDWCLPGETWLPIPDWEGWYESSDYGRARSCDRTFTRSNGRPLTRHGQILRPSPNSWGYLSVRLSAPGSRLTRTVHRLVLEAFVGPCPEGQETRHLNGRKRDNRLSNLVFGSHAENMIDRELHGYGMREQHRRGEVPPARVNRNREKTHCPQGHPLQAPNLVIMKANGRSCRACSRARAYMRSQRLRFGAEHDFPSLADRYFEAIMRGDPSRCRYGHPIAGANVCRANRGCLACERARSAVTHARKRHGVLLDMQAVSDAKYAEIMREAVA